jgi:hypothetical protein
LGETSFGLLLALILRSGPRRWNDLIKRLALTDHPEIGTRAFLDSGRTLFQILHFSS